jgi:geranylgeranyl pyrophosphate synthase
MRQSGSIDYALEQAKLQIERAKQSLSLLPANPSKAALLGFADNVIMDIV